MKAHLDEAVRIFWLDVLAIKVRRDSGQRIQQANSEESTLIQDERKKKKNDLKDAGKQLGGGGERESGHRENRADGKLNNRGGNKPQLP